MNHRVPLPEDPDAALFLAVAIGETIAEALSHYPGELTRAGVVAGLRMLANEIETRAPQRPAEG